MELPFRQAVAVCVFDGCEDDARTRGLCYGHYSQWINKGELLPKRGTRPARVCTYDGCDRPHSCFGLCVTHASQVRRGKNLKPISRRIKYLTSAPGGYLKVFAPDHPNATKKGYILQHVLVMSTLLDRPLLAGENVHHLNGDRTDNRPNNLELWSHSQPKGQRIEDKVAWAIELLNTYRPDLLNDKGAS